MSLIRVRLVKSIHLWRMREIAIVASCIVIVGFGFSVGCLTPLPTVSPLRIAADPAARGVHWGPFDSMHWYGLGPFGREWSLDDTGPWPYYEESCDALDVIQRIKLHRQHLGHRFIVEISHVGVPEANYLLRISSDAEVIDVPLLWQPAKLRSKPIVQFVGELTSGLKGVRYIRSTAYTGLAYDIVTTAAIDPSLERDEVPTISPITYKRGTGNK